MFDYCWNTMLEEKYSDEYEWYIAAPTQAHTLRWLREEFHIHVTFDIRHHPEFGYKAGIYAIDNNILHNDVETDYYKSYEELCEVVLKLCLTEFI